MVLDRNNVIQVNATIITGLLILLSLQSISSPIYDTKVIDSLNRMADSGINYNQVHNLYDDYCLKQINATFTYLNSTDINEFCKKLEIEKLKVDQQGDVLYNYLQSFSILGNNVVTSNTWITIWGPYYAKIITIVIMLPFISSILFEIRNKQIDAVSDKASKTTMTCFSLGMWMLLIGIMLIMFMIFLTAPWQNLATNPH